MISLPHSNTTIKMPPIDLSHRYAPSGRLPTNASGNNNMAVLRVVAIAETPRWAVGVEVTGVFQVFCSNFYNATSPSTNTNDILKNIRWLTAQWHTNSNTPALKFSRKKHRTCVAFRCHCSQSVFQVFFYHLF